MYSVFYMLYYTIYTCCQHVGMSLVPYSWNLLVIDMLLSLTDYLHCIHCGRCVCIGIYSLSYMLHLLSYNSKNNFHLILSDLHMALPYQVLTTFSPSYLSQLCECFAVLQAFTLALLYPWLFLISLKQN